MIILGTGGLNNYHRTLTVELSVLGMANPYIQSPVLLCIALQHIDTQEVQLHYVPGI